MAPGTERVRGAYHVVKTLYRHHSCGGHCGMKARRGCLKTEAVVPKMALGVLLTTATQVIVVPCCSLNTKMGAP